MVDPMVVRWVDLTAVSSVVELGLQRAVLMVASKVVLKVAS